MLGLLAAVLLVTALVITGRTCSVVLASWLRAPTPGSSRRSSSSAP